LDLQLPEAYIPDAALRLSFYKRLASITDDASLAELEDEVIDRYGPAPPQLDSLFVAQRIRMSAQAAGFMTLARRKDRWRIRLDPESAPPQGLVEALGSWPGASITPGGEVTLPIAGSPDLGTLLEFVRQAEDQR
jgi:transcription-repair coupling factor (superfamily II helicase)